jgi:hypothetical protein
MNIRRLKIFKYAAIGAAVMMLERCGARPHDTPDFIGVRRV